MELEEGIVMGNFTPIIDGGLHLVFLPPDPVVLVNGGDIEAEIVFYVGRNPKRGRKISVNRVGRVEFINYNLVAGWWDFNDPEDPYKDISGNNNDGTCTSCPELIQGGGAPGLGGNALSFNEDGQRVETKHMSLGNKVTFSAWVYRYESTNSYNMFIGQHLPYFAFISTNRFFFSIYISGSQKSLTSISSYEDNKWYHYTATFDGEYMRLYIDGQPDGSSYQPGDVTYFSSYKFSIGDGRSSTWYPFSGLVDDVRIYTAALTAEQIQRIYAETKHKYIAEK